MPSIALYIPRVGKRKKKDVEGDGIEWEVNKLLTRADGQVVDTHITRNREMLVVRSSVDNTLHQVPFFVNT